MKVAIIGGGNIGTQFAVHCSAVGHDTIIYTSKPKLFSEEISIIDENSSLLLKGKVEVTDNIEIACSKAELIFITLPASMMEDVSEKMYPYLRKGVYIGLVPGTGGGECSFKAAIDKGCILFGLQRVPSVARLVEYGRCVKATGYRNELHVAAIPYKYTMECCNMVSNIFGKVCTMLPNYLNVTLTPSNPILHTTRLYSLFKDYKKGMLYDRIPLFYEDWSEEASRLLFLCDAEVQEICRALDKIDLDYVKSLKEHYESITEDDLTRKIRSIDSFKGISTPSKKIEGKYEPDLESRYFTSDFPYGLAIIIQVAEFVDIEVPNCKTVLQWYYDLTKDRTGFFYGSYGIKNIDDFYDFYTQ